MTAKGHLPFYLDSDGISDRYLCLKSADLVSMAAYPSQRMNGTGKQAHGWPGAVFYCKVVLTLTQNRPANGRCTWVVAVIVVGSSLLSVEHYW